MVSVGREFFKSRYEKLGGEIVDLNLNSCIRINPLKIAPNALLERLSKQGVVLERLPTKFGFEVVKSSFSLGAITEFLLGYYSLQGLAAQFPVEVLNPTEQDVLLDCCAAPGNKTTQMAEAMDNRGKIISFELKPHRLPSLVMTLERCGIKNTTVFQGDAVSAPKLGVRFDKVLLDAPCSGNFVGEPLWFEKRDLVGIERSSEFQKKLLQSAVRVLKPGGVLVYSTCSLEPEENELNMQWALDNLGVRLEKVNLKIGDPGLTVVFGKELDQSIALCRRFWPKKTNTEGFFIAKLVKNDG